MCLLLFLEMCEFRWTLDVFLSHVACRVSSQNTQPRAQDGLSPKLRKTTPTVLNKQTRVDSPKEESEATKAMLEHHESPPEEFLPPNL